MPNQQSPLDLAFQALADPTRRAIVERLAAGPASVGELARPFEMALPSVMQHLRLLEGAGLVRSKKEGRVRTCQLDAEALARTSAWIDQRRREWEARFDRLAAYVETLRESPE